MSELLDDAVAAVRAETRVSPQVAIVLGSGMGRFADRVEDATVIPYSTIPGFVTATATGHEGRLVLGNLRGVPVLTMQGRFHLYEGHAPEAIAFPIRLMVELGVHTYLATNASGGVHPHLEVGDIVVVREHIDLMYRISRLMKDLPLKSHSRSGLMPYYDEKLAEAALEAARRGNFRAVSGVYTGFLGPNYETRSEYRMLRVLGSDVVGMSTIPEILVARQLGMRCAAFSIVTNAARPDALGVTTGDAVVAAADEMEPYVSQLLLAAIES